MESERLWRVWWLWGAPFALAVGVLIVLAEIARDAGYGSLGDLLDIMRLALYWLWLRLAWKCSRNVDHAIWTPLARAALAAGLVVNALT